MKFLICLAALVALNGVYSTEFNYEVDGPDAWPTLFAACAGHQQSPLNINTAFTVEDATLDDFQFINYDVPIQFSQTFNGHTIIHYPQNVTASIAGSNFNETFDLLQFHFHWGYNDYQGSEHQVNGKKFPLEAHLVHKGRVSGSLAVVGILFQLSENDNSEIQPVFDYISELSNSNPTQLVTFKLKDIIQNPSVMNLGGYYRYAGSLTTPPCTQGVIWSVFEHRLPISDNQLQVLHNNYQGAFFREIQPLDGRAIYFSKWAQWNGQ